MSSIEIEEEDLLGSDRPRQQARIRRAASTPQQAAQSILSSYVSRRFMSGSPLFEYLFGFHVFGLGFLTSMLFIFCTGVFTSSWIGSIFVGMGEWTIRKLPLVKHIYNAAKQVSAAVSPSDGATNSFRECVIIRHPRVGEYAFGFITGQTILQTDDGELELFSVYVPTNHVYVGDIFLLGEKDIIRSTLSVREGIEIVVSVGMAVPPRILQVKK
ncbi:hypothetical protein N2152v2_009561 [Parachlorella kessleri]